MDTEGLPLRDAIQSLRAEIADAVISAEGQSPQFELQGIEMELQLVISNVGKGKVGASLWRVITAEAAYERSSVATHRVVLKLTPTDTLRVNR